MILFVKEAFLILSGVNRVGVEEFGSIAAPGLCRCNGEKYEVCGDD